MNKPELIHFVDLSDDTLARQYVKTATVKASFAKQDGEMATLEGVVPYVKGDAILTGVTGEKWPVVRRIFDALYEPVLGQAADTYKKKAGSAVYAKQMVTAFRVKIREGSATLEGKPGDWLVQYAIGDVGVIANNIFVKSYRALDS